MRRMRGFFNGWVVTLIFTATLGYFAVRHWPKPETPSIKVPTASTVEQGTDAGVGSNTEAKAHKPSTPNKVSRDIAHVREHDDEGVSERHETRPSPRLRGSAPSFCESVEFRGAGPESGPGGQWGRITTEQWGKVMAEFHQSKKDLLAWLDEHRSQFSREAAEHMEAEVKELRLQRPPTPDFPDLAFRGIGLWTRPPGERPIIKLGGGFAKLVEKHPQRARFELSRLIAQTWAPCELGRSPIAAHLPREGAWSSILSCLNVRDKSACQPGSFSEAGWAISSAIASVASPPGCTVPAFASGVGDSCLREIRSLGSRLPASAKKSSHGSAAAGAPRSAQGSAAADAPRSARGGVPARIKEAHP